MRCRMPACRTEEPRRFAVTAGFAGQNGEALQGVGDTQIRMHASGDRERVVGVALGLLRFTLRQSPRGTVSSAPRSSTSRSWS